MKAEKGPLLGVQWPQHSGSHKSKLAYQTKDGRHREHEVENPNLDLPLVKLLQREHFVLFCSVLELVLEETQAQVPLC